VRCTCGNLPGPESIASAPTLVSATGPARRSSTANVGLPGCAMPHSLAAASPPKLRRCCRDSRAADEKPKPCLYVPAALSFSEMCRHQGGNRVQDQHALLAHPRCPHEREGGWHRALLAIAPQAAPHPPMPRTRHASGIGGHTPNRSGWLRITHDGQFGIRGPNPAVSRQNPSRVMCSERSWRVGAMAAWEKSSVSPACIWQLRRAGGRPARETQNLPSVRRSGGVEAATLHSQGLSKVRIFGVKQSICSPGRALCLFGDIYY